MQLFDSTSERRFHIGRCCGSYRKNTILELKAVFEVTHRAPWHKLKDDDATDHSCSNDGVIQLGPLGSDVMFEVAESSDACFVHLL